MYKWKQTSKSLIRCYVFCTSTWIRTTLPIAAEPPWITRVARPLSHDPPRRNLRRYSVPYRSCLPPSRLRCRSSLLYCPTFGPRCSFTRRRRRRRRPGGGVSLSFTIYTRGNQRSTLRVGAATANLICARMEH